jgi:serine O-acetyltransferase
VLDVGARTKGKHLIDERLGLWRLIREDLIANNRDWSQPGFRALVMYRFGVWTQSIPKKRRIARRLAGLVYRSMHRYVRNRYSIELHRTARIGRRLRIAHQGAIVIHRFAEIGNDCVIRQGVTLGNAGRGVVRDEAPKLGNEVKVGTGAVILGRVTIGDGARIGPNTVILSDVPPGATAFAPPPRMIYSPYDASAEEAPELPAT